MIDNKIIDNAIIENIMPSSFPGIAEKKVLITGGSRGIGRAIAIAFAKAGAYVSINFRNNKRAAEETAKIIQTVSNCRNNYSPLLLQADLSNKEEIQNMFIKYWEKFESLDILINNAAIQHETPSHLLSIEELERDLRVDLLAPAICSQFALKHFVKESKRGIIINITSPHEIIPKPGFLGYSLSKGGMGNLTRTLALEYAKYGIRVNAIGPGATLTDMNASWANEPKKRANVEKHIPLGRAVSPEEIAPSVLFLASEWASYITGQTLYVDGGAVLFPEYRENWSS